MHRPLCVLCGCLTGRCPPPTHPPTAVATVHIPFFLDGNASCTYRGQSYIDGVCPAARPAASQRACSEPACLPRRSAAHPPAPPLRRSPSMLPCSCSLCVCPAGSLWDFIMSENSDLIQCNGEACVVDYVSVARGSGVPACRGSRGGLGRACSVRLGAGMAVPASPAFCRRRARMLPRRVRPPTRPPPSPPLSSLSSLTHSSTTTSSSGAAWISSSWLTCSRCRPLCRPATPTRSAPTPDVRRCSGLGLGAGLRAGWAPKGALLLLPPTPALTGAPPHTPPCPPCSRLLRVCAGRRAQGGSAPAAGGAAVGGAPHACLY